MGGVLMQKRVQKVIFSPSAPFFKYLVLLQQAGVSAGLHGLGAAFHP